jgi:hypothetical protein
MNCNVSSIDGANQHYDLPSVLIAICCVQVQFGGRSIVDLYMNFPCCDARSKSSGISMRKFSLIVFLEQRIGWGINKNES